MIITCEACGTSYKIKAGLISKDGSSVKCSRCQHIFVAYPPVAESEEAAEYSPESGVSNADYPRPQTPTFSEDEAETEEALNNLFFEEAEEESSAEKPSREEEPAESEIGPEFDSEALFAEFEKEFEEEPEPEEEFGEPETPDLEIDTAEDSAPSGPEPEAEEFALADLESAEEEIGFSDLESGAEELDFAQLESEGEELDFSQLESGAEEIDFSDLESAPDSEGEEISFSNLEPESEEITLSALETGAKSTRESGFDDTVQEEFDLDLEKEIFEKSTRSHGRSTFSGKSTLEDTKLTDVTLSDLEFEGEEVWMADLEAVTQEIGFSDLETGTEQIDLSELEPGSKPESESKEISFSDLEAGAKEISFSDLEAGAEEIDLSGLESEIESEIESEEEPLSLSNLEHAREEKPEKQPEPADMGESAKAEEKEAALEASVDEEFDFDLDLDEEEMPAQEAEETDLDLDDLDFDLDLSLETEEEMKTDQESSDQAQAAPETEAAGNGMELEIEVEEDDLEFAEQKEPTGSGQEEEQGFDFGLEKEPEKASSEEDLFEFDLGLEEKEETGHEEDQELSLTNMDDFLEKPETRQRGAGETTEFSLDLETAPETGAAGKGEDDFDIDLSTMLDDAAEEESGTEEDFSMEPGEDEDFEPPEDRQRTRVTSAETVEYPGEAADEEEVFEKKPYSSAAPFPAEGRGRGKKILKALVLLIVLGLIGGGAYLYLTGQQLPGLRQPSVQDRGNMRIAVSSPDYSIVDNENAGSLLMISGSVTNRYDHPRSHILIRANLLDGNGNRVGRAAAYSGNIFEEGELEALDMETINGRLSRKQGQGGVNVSVGPGQSLPYMIVISNLPDNMESLTVEALSSDKAD